MSSNKEEEVNLIVKKMNKFCKFKQNGDKNSKTKLSKKQQEKCSTLLTTSQQQQQQQSMMANNNDDNFTNEYTDDSQLLSNNDKTNQLNNNDTNEQDGRISGGSNKSLSNSSSSSAFYDECEESEHRNNLLTRLNSSTTTTTRNSHDDKNKLITNSRRRSSTSTSSSSLSIQNSLSSSLSSAASGENNNQSSGRSSANNLPDILNDECDQNEVVNNRINNHVVKLLNPIPNLIPENEDYYKLVDKIRVRFLEEIKDDLILFDNCDLEEFNKSLPPINKQEQSLTFRFISRYLNNKLILDLLSKKNDNDNRDNNLEEQINQCIESLKSLLKFRNQYKLSNVLEDQFSREFYILNGAFVFGHDKQNIPVFYMRARVHRRWSKTLDESFRRYLSWQLDLITKSNHQFLNVKKSIGLNGIEKDGSFGICFDCADVGYSCLDMDFLRFIVNLLVNYYPTYCRYALCVDLPWLFRSVWKLVKSWLPEDAQNSVQLITSKQLIEFIDEDQIPNSIKINDLKASEKPIKNKHSLPNNWSSIKGIDELGKDMNLSSNEIKQFKLHVEKLRKEYELLGAI